MRNEGCQTQEPANSLAQEDRGRRLFADSPRPGEHRVVLAAVIPLPNFLPLVRHSACEPVEVPASKRRPVCSYSLQYDRLSEALAGASGVVRYDVAYFLPLVLVCPVKRSRC